MPAMRRTIVSALMLAACRDASPPPQPLAAAATSTPADSLTLLATLTYRERIALPPEAKAYLALTADTTPGTSPLAVLRVDLDGRQVPILMEMPVERAKLVPGAAHYARGGITVNDRPTWVTDVVPADVRGRGVELGTLVMRRWVASGFRSALRCGDQPVTVGFRDEVAIVEIAGESFELPQVRSASGARFEHPSDRGTWLWNKGKTTRISVRGKELPECTAAGGDPAAPAPFRAHGNEPFWSVELSGDRMTFRTPEGVQATTPQPAPETIPGGTRWTAVTEAHRLVVTSLDRRCVDDMSGMPSPRTVTVTLDGKEYRGCGGDPALLLEGAEWVVEDIDRGGIIDRSRVSLRFGPERRLAGRAGCNTYTGSYLLTGESLTASQLAVTQMACSPALASQEAKFLEILRAVERFEITEDGALVLHTATGRTLTARR